MKILKIFKKPVFLITLVVLAAVLSISVVAAEGATETFGKVTEYRVGMQGCLYLELTVDTKGMVADDYFEISVDGRAETETVKTSEITDGKFLVKLAPAEMNKDVTVTAKRANGTEGCTKTLNVTAYAKEVLANPEHATTFHDPMRTLLNWGAKSEAFFGKGTTINIGDVFTRDSDPSTVVTAANITSPDKADITASGIFSKNGNILDLILDEGNISLCFKLKASANVSALEATVSRDGYKNNAKVTYGGGYYTVKVNGITTSRFDDVYTVTVSDGGENTITAQASVLEYLYKILNDESVHATKPTEQKATAQALFQFYQATTNTFSSAECTHPAGNSFWIHKAGESDVSYCRCSLCFGDLKTKVPDSINFFANFQTMTYSAESGASYKKDDTTQIEYTEFTKGGNLYITNGKFVDATPITSAKYLVVKYRMTGNGFAFYFGGNDNQFPLLGVFNNTDGGAKWRVSVIELKDVFSDFSDETIKLQAGFGSAVDVAFIALTDSYDEARELMTVTDDVYVVLGHHDSTASNKIVNTTKITDISEFLCSSGHNVTAVTSGSVAGGTKYTYSCSRAWCDLTYETTVPASAKAYTSTLYDSNRISSWGPTWKEQKCMYDVDNDVLFNRYSNSPYNIHIKFQDKTYEPGKYVVIKYRTTSGSLYIDKAGNTSADGEWEDVGCLEPTAGEWRVVVIDMSTVGKWPTAASKLYIMFTGEVQTDLAYVATFNSLADIKDLVKADADRLYTATPTLDRGQKMTANKITLADLVD